MTHNIWQSIRKLWFLLKHKMFCSTGPGSTCCWVEAACSPGKPLGSEWNLATIFYHDKYFLCARLSFIAYFHFLDDQFPIWVGMWAGQSGFCRCMAQLNQTSQPTKNLRLVVKSEFYSLFLPYFCQTFSHHAALVICGAKVFLSWIAWLSMCQREFEMGYKYMMKIWKDWRESEKVLEG